MVRSYHIASSRISPCDDNCSQITLFVDPTEEERQYLTHDLGIDEHTLQSALDPDELSRLEFEDNYVGIIYKRPRNYSAADNLLFKIMSSGVFLLDNRLIVLMPDDAPLFDGKLFTRVRSLNDVVLRLIYRSAMHFLEHLKVINMISDELEQKVKSSMENRVLINMFTLEKSLVYYLNAINGNSVLLERLKMSAARLKFTPDELDLLADIAIENNQCYKQADIYSNILASLMDARVSIVSNNLNILMKTLNIITIMIMVPTLVVSAFSMNVGIPLSGHPLAFWFIMGFATISVALFILFWRYKKW